MTTLDYKYTAKQSEEIERIRDYFAGLAMQAMVKDYLSNDRDYIEGYWDRISRAAYNIADAMIKEKLKRRNVCNKNESE